MSRSKETQQKCNFPCSSQLTAHSELQTENVFMLPAAFVVIVIIVVVLCGFCCCSWTARIWRSYVEASSSAAVKHQTNRNPTQSVAPTKLGARLLSAGNTQRNYKSFH